jgi:hypothetical protein
MSDTTAQKSFRNQIGIHELLKHFHEIVIAYRAPKSTFLRDAPTIEDKISSGVKEKLGIDINVESSEYESWKNSVGNAMFIVINNSNLSDDSEIAIEYKIAGIEIRIDFLISSKIGEIGIA